MDNSSQWETKKWVTVERPGPLGKSKDAKYREWDEKYGKGMWRIDFEGKDGQAINFEYIVSEYVRGYIEYFKNFPLDAYNITRNFSYVYDRDFIDKDAAFDIYALYDQPGKQNQFRHAAINIALVQLGYEFQGNEPIQVRMSSSSGPLDASQLGWRMAPGQFICSHPELIPDTDFQDRWWKKGSIEDFYQSCKALKVLK